MKATDLYNQAHLFVSAMRILAYKNSAPPAIDDVCDLLSISREQGHYICRKLQEHDAVKLVESAYGPRLFISDHLKLEEIPVEEQGDRLQEALKAFQSARQGHSQKVAAIQKEQTQKKKNLFADLEKQLKKNLNKT
ncbi:MAG: hypothetical protein LJE94_07865 [Deltaproteobacteria bacterium]|jgi:hypothetical protein|nr:hypothetical protein [Deltaproteobacteria bacterium]